MTPLQALDRAVTQAAKDREMWNSLDCTPAIADLVRAKIGAMGFVIVPAEPSEAMLNCLIDNNGIGPTTAGNVYRAMIEASDG